MSAEDTEQSSAGRILRAIHQLDEKIETLDRKVDRLMASVESVTAALTQLKTDLEGLATAAKAEFAKLEKEVAEGKPANLTPVEEAINAIDTAVKAAVVPTT